MTSNFKKSLISWFFLLLAFGLFFPILNLLARLSPEVAFALAMANLVVCLIISASVGRCWKCNRSLFLSPSELWVSPVIWWGSCPRCSVGYFDRANS